MTGKFPISSQELPRSDWIQAADWIWRLVSLNTREGHLMREFMFERSEKEIWEKHALCSTVSPSALVSSSSLLGSHPRAPGGPSPLTVCGCSLPLPAVTLSLEGSREDILPLTSSGCLSSTWWPGQVDICFVTSNEEITPSKQLIYFYTVLTFQKIFTMSMPPDSEESHLLGVPLCYSAAKSGRVFLTPILLKL